jgi:hypothetical protein
VGFFDATICLFQTIRKLGKSISKWNAAFFEDKVHVLEEEKKRRKMLLPDDKKNLNTTTKPNQGEQIGFDF